MNRFRGVSTVGVLAAFGLTSLLLVWAANSGPGALATGGPRAQTATSTVTSRPAHLHGVLREARHLRHQLAPDRVVNLSWLGESIEVVLLLVLGLLLWRWALYVRRRAEETAPVPRIAAEFAVLPGELSRHLAADRDVHLAGLDSGSPRNGIVRCWMSFEESATRAGVPPRGSETSTEFVSRLLRSLDLDPRPAARLAELYRVARFSSHRLTTEDRESARQALLALHHELGSAGTLPAEGEVLR